MSRSSSNPNSDPSTPDDDSPIFFGPFEVTSQVFLRTPLSFALVNLKPLLPGHVLVCPRAAHRRLTDLSAPELTDLWSAVQRVQRVLARYYFGSADDLESGGSFNLALQDGPESGQTVPHVHVHVIPRIRGSTAKSVETPSDELYERMAGEDGNVGGALWDRDMGRDRGRDGNQGGMLAAAIPRRPEGGGSFPSIEDAQRQARSMEEMEEEAALYKRCLEELEGKKTRKGEGVKGEA
ncbi:HIT-like domain-containing protein [Cladorrhinum samala]|uniref:Bis(5'-adenosyl)-triphosphatase n=1 Tax=Cladorrhinum samala TaxID=585594 RepID=A0AAV9HUN1_9PEZI|nr:HIT-like domain-containing protein [Cladorrhinum samala]